MVAKPLCPLYKNIIKPLDRARYPELRYNVNGISGTSVSVEGIKQLRKSLKLQDYFAFLKRNGLAMKELGLEKYQLLLPIPENAIDMNPNLTQNPGY